MVRVSYSADGLNPSVCRTSEHIIRVLWSVGGTEDLGTTGQRGESERERGTGEGKRANGSGSRPFPWNGAIGWSPKHVGGRKRKGLIGGWGGQVRDYVQRRLLFRYEPRVSR